MKRIIAQLIAGSVLMTFASVAHAQVLGQTSETVAKPLTVKVGAFFPSNSKDAHVAGATQISAGLDYAFQKTTQSNPTLPSVYFDYNGGSRNGFNASTYGLGLAIRSYTASPSGNTKSSVSPYVGAGVGAYYIQGSGHGFSANTTNVGGKVFAGLEFGGGWLAEANYQILPSLKGVNVSGFGLQVGARF